MSRRAYVACWAVGVTAGFVQGAPVGQVRITSGLADQRVYQRNGNDADVVVEGTVRPIGLYRLEYRVLRRAQTVAGFDWTPIEAPAPAASSVAHWMVKVEKVPVGGPYRFEFRLTDEQGVEADGEDVDGIWVGDLWILAGQSNMDGCGDLAEAEPPGEAVHCLSLANTWQIAEDPMHYCNEAAYTVYRTSYVSPTERRPVPHRPRGPWPQWPSRERALGAGLGIPFGKRVHEVAGVPIGLILCSLGGTTMKQWSPELKDQGSDSLYGAMLDRVSLAGGQVAGVLWYQGESDSYGEGAIEYEERFTRFIEAVRTDLNNRDLPFFTVQIGVQKTGRPVDPSGKNLVREAQRRCMERIPGCGLVSAIDCEMSSSAHIDTAGYKKVGRRLANLALARVYGRDHIKPGPRLKSVQIGGPKRDTIRVSFEDVNGRLRATGPFRGLQIESVDADGSTTLVDPLRVEADPEEPAVLWIRTVLPVSSEARLWYGYGWEPYCNVVDELDMAVPAFGPVPLK